MQGRGPLDGQAGHRAPGAAQAGLQLKGRVPGGKALQHGEALGARGRPGALRPEAGAELQLLGPGRGRRRPRDLQRRVVGPQAQAAVEGHGLGPDKGPLEAGRRRARGHKRRGIDLHHAILAREPQVAVGRAQGGLAHEAVELPVEQPVAHPEPQHWQRRLGPGGEGLGLGSPNEAQALVARDPQPALIIDQHGVQGGPVDRRARAQAAGLQRRPRGRRRAPGHRREAEALHAGGHP